MTKPPLIPLDMPDTRLRTLTHALDGGGPITDASDLLTCLRLARDLAEPYTRQAEVHGALAAMAAVLVRTYSKDALALSLVYGEQRALYSSTLDEAVEHLDTLSAKLKREADGWDLLLTHLAAWRHIDTLGRRTTAAKGKPVRKAKGRAAL